jgi:cytochrome P450
VDAVDVTAPGFRLDPYPDYAALRAAAPLHRAHVLGMPGWVTYDHETAEQLLADPRVSSDHDTADPRLREAAPWAFLFDDFGLGRSMLLVDPPEHTRLRRVVSRSFTPRRIEALRPRVQAACDELLDAVLPHGRADLVDDVALHLPLIVIMELLGLPAGDRHDFHAWCVTAATDLDDPPAQLAAYARIRDYLDGLVARKRAENARRGPGPDLMSALISTRDEAGSLTDDEVRSTAYLLLFAGHETTTDFLGNAVIALLRHPEQLAALRADPSLMPGAVEELVRFDGSVTVSNFRFAREEVRIGDAVVAPGEAIFIATCAVNHDPKAFDRPDVLDIHRMPSRNLAFGQGVHYCLGAPLARMEASVFLHEVVTRCEELALAVDENEIEWRRGPNLRGPRHLPVRFRAVGREVGLPGGARGES